MQLSWKGVLLSPAIASAFFAILLVALGLAPERPLLGFLLLFTAGCVVAYGVFVFAFLPVVWLASRFVRMTAVRFAALGGLTGALFVVPLTWMEWKSSGPDSGPPEQTFAEFATSWFSDPGIALDLVFPVAGIITAAVCWRLSTARPNPGAPEAIQ
jgi:hypothetical protein